MGEAQAAVLIPITKGNNTKMSHFFIFTAFLWNFKNSQDYQFVHDLLSATP
jgi:hypothetical protein